MRPVDHPSWHGPVVTLFLLDEADVGEDYVSWLNDPRVNRYLESRFATHTIESTRAFVRGCLDDAGSVLFGIRDPSLGGRHVGNIKIGPIDRRHGLGEVGLMIGEPQAWGRGLGTAAIAAAREVAWQQLGLRKLTAGCYASNVGSERAFLRAGFEVEGRRREHFLLDGRPEDLVLMAMWRNKPGEPELLPSARH